METNDYEGRDLDDLVADLSIPARELRRLCEERRPKNLRKLTRDETRALLRQELEFFERLGNELGLGKARRYGNA